MTHKRALILSDFTDAGTGESFTAGDTPLIKRGAHANYEAAGLVGTPAAAHPAPRATTKPKARAKRKAATAIAEPAPAPAPASAPAEPAGPSSEASDLAA